MLSWETLDWQSLATLITGGAAVIGATWVGIRQAGITSRQAEIAHAQNAILSRQVEIEAQKLKADLFERRFRTYELCRKYLKNQGLVSEIERTSFVEKVAESQALFGQRVFDSLRMIYEHGESYRLISEEMRKEHQQGHDHDPAKLAKADEHIGWMFARTMSLWTVFAADLRLDGVK